MAKQPDPKTQERVYQKLDILIDKLIDKEPFFGHIINQLRLHMDECRDEVKTIGTNGRGLYIDSEWFDKTVSQHGDDAMLGVLAHEACHIAFGHPWRGRGKNQDRWSKAIDAVVNDILVSRNWKLPPDGFFYPGARDMTSEDVYRQLMQNGGSGQDNQGRQKGSQSAWGDNLDGDSGNDKQPGEGHDDGEMEGREGVAKAAQKAREAGNMPGYMEKMILQGFLPQKDWRDELKRFLGGGEIKEPSWARPNRRFIHQGQYLPGSAKFGPGEIVLAIDVSGSIDNSLLSKFLAEVNKVNEDLQPDKIHVMTCDTRVPWTETFGPYDSVAVPRKAVTGGGTAFSPVFKKVMEMGVEPKALVYFTDLYCSDFGEQPDYPVLWVVWPGGADRKPWGELVKMDD